jgi:membrane protein implicated in regulation of membrane protease activity
MGSLLGLLLVFAVLLTIMLGLSVGIAFLIHWLLPVVGLEMALLVAVIAVGQAMLVFGRVLNALPPPLQEDDLGPPLVILDRDVALPRRRRKRT